MLNCISPNSSYRTPEGRRVHAILDFYVVLSVYSDPSTPPFSGEFSDGRSFYIIEACLRPHPCRSHVPATFCNPIAYWSATPRISLPAARSSA